MSSPPLPPVSTASSSFSPPSSSSPPRPDGTASHRTSVPSLEQLARLCLINHAEYLEDIGHVPVALLATVLRYIPPQQLRIIERNSPSIQPDTDEIWRQHCARQQVVAAADFDKPERMSWRAYFSNREMRQRELYLRAQRRYEEERQREADAQRTVAVLPEPVVAVAGVRKRSAARRANKRRPTSAASRAKGSQLLRQCVAAGERRCQRLAVDLRASTAAASALATSVPAFAPESLSRSFPGAVRHSGRTDARSAASAAAARSARAGDDMKRSSAGAAPVRGGRVRVERDRRRSPAAQGQGRVAHASSAPVFAPVPGRAAASPSPSPSPSRWSPSSGRGHGSRRPGEAARGASPAAHSHSVTDRSSTQRAPVRGVQVRERTSAGAPEREQRASAPASALSKSGKILASASVRLF